MAKQGKVCAGCGTSLSFMNTPNFGSGYLQDGERVCRSCFARIVKIQPSFGLRSKKDHTRASIQQILDPERVEPGANAGGDGPTDARNRERTDDPVSICMDALKTGRSKGTALEAAKQAHRLWWAIDVSDREHSMEELTALLELRAFVLASVATVHVWNGEYEVSDELQPQFIDHEGLWSSERREAVELYLIHLTFQKQWDRIEVIFSRTSFRSAFLDYHDLYKSVRDPNYEFQSKQGPFLNTVNKVNQYCTQIGVEKLL